jgi:hypothetical protein
VGGFYEVWKAINKAPGSTGDATNMVKFNITMNVGRMALPAQGILEFKAGQEPRQQVFKTFNQNS